MNTILKFFAHAHLFAFFTISFAMQDIDIQDVVVFNNPFSVHYVSNRYIAISSIIKSCVLDLKKHTARYVPYDLDANCPHIENIMIQSNDEKIVVAKGESYIIFDQKKDKYLSFDCPKMTSLKIDSSNNLLFTTDRSRYLFSTNYDTAGFFRKDLECRRVLDVNERKGIICIEDHYGDVAIHDFYNFQEYETIKIPEIIYKKKNTLKYQLSADTSYLACGNTSCIYKATIGKSASCEPFIKSLPGEQFKCMVFLPDENILATVSKISDTKSAVKYWDFEEPQAENCLLSFDLDEVNCRDISFAPNGKEGIIAFKGKCIRMSVPFF